MKAKIGDERYLVEMISAVNVEALARTRGWKNEEESGGLREYVEPDDAAIYKAFKTLAEAQTAAKEWLATGRDFYGCVIIDRQTFQQPHDDSGNLIRVPAEWETEQTFEVAMDGETIDVAA